MHSKVRAYLQLVRLPNLFTAAADVFAGFFYCGGQWADWLILVRLSLASMCLYAGGVALNDVCDARRDAAERPNRPIPSGRVDLGAALRLSITLLIFGVAVAATVSLQSAGISLALAISIAVYDFVLKQTFVAPAIMGACRGLNVALGMCAATQWTSSRAPWLPIGIVWLYITSVTAFARTESRVSNRWRLGLATAGMCVAIAGLCTIGHWAPQAVHTQYMWPADLLLLWVGYNGIVATASPSPEIIQRSVTRFIISLILLDACITWSAGDVTAATATVSLLVPTAVLARAFRVT